MRYGGAGGREEGGGGGRRSFHLVLEYRTHLLSTMNEMVAGVRWVPRGFVTESARDLLSIVVNICFAKM